MEHIAKSWCIDSIVVSRVRKRRNQCLHRYPHGRVGTASELSFHHWKRIVWGKKETETDLPSNGWQFEALDTGGGEEKRRSDAVSV